MITDKNLEFFDLEVEFMKKFHLRDYGKRILRIRPGKAFGNIYRHFN